MVCFVLNIVIKIYPDLIVYRQEDQWKEKHQLCSISFINSGHQLTNVTIEVKHMLTVVVLLDGGHDLYVLEGAVCSVIVSVATGNACAMAHSDRGRGQLRQALVLAIHCQLIWKVQPRHAKQKWIGIGEDLPSLRTFKSLKVAYKFSWTHTQALIPVVVGSFLSAILSVK